MMRHFVWVVLLSALVASVSAVSLAARAHDATTPLSPRADSLAAANATAAAQLMHPQAADIASFFESARETLTTDDFLAVPFDPADAGDAKVLAALTRNAAGFAAWREGVARAHYHMELADYEALFSARRASLLDLAAQLSVPVETHKTSFDALLRRVDAALSARERRSPKGAATASFVEARVAVSLLHEQAHLFRGRSTLHSLLVQDAVMYGVGEEVSAAFDWVVNNVAKHGCTLCKGIIAQLRRSFCKAAGAAICTALVGLMSGPLASIASKFFCAFPLYLSSLFTGWCIKGVLWLQDKLKLSDTCLCSFSIPSFVIPATDFNVMGLSVFKSPKKDVKIGQICKTQPGQCAGSSTEDSQKYAKMTAAQAEARIKAQSEEAEKVNKMSKTEKVKYHTQILEGKIKTSLDDRLLQELLGAFTGLGKSVVGSLAKGATELAKGNVKGAVATVAGDVAKNTVKTVAKNVATTAAKGVTKAAVGATVTSTVNYAAELGGKQVAKAADNAGKAVGNTVQKAGTAVVNGAAKVTGAVTGDKNKAAAVKTTGQNAVNKAANATGKAAATALGVAGGLAVDVTRNAVSSHANAKITGPAAGKVAATVSGAFDSKPKLF